MRLTTGLVLAVIALALTGGVLLAADDYDVEIDPADFEIAPGVPFAIDNPWQPFTPGTTYIYEGETEDGFERIEVFVSFDTKTILGVVCTVVEDRAYLQEEEGGDFVLMEETFDWYAQDFTGNIWYFGEDSVEFDEEGNPDPAGSWEAGVDGALPGILMPASPVPGLSYRQEFLEDEAEDEAKVLRTNAEVTLESLTIDGETFEDVEYEDVLKTKEWTQLEPGESIENKYYAEGVGLIREVAHHGGKQTIDLVEIIN